MKKFLLLIIFLMIPFFASPASAQPIPVDLELSLLVDVSGSVDQTEYALQRDGYKAAFLNSVIHNKILGGVYGSIAVNYIEWDSTATEKVSWTLIDSEAASIAFGNTIGALTNDTIGNTAPGTAINTAVPLFSSNIYDGTRKVIDVSGDGQENTGADTSTARDAALAAGIDAINGLSIGSDSLETWYNGNIKGGSNAFVVSVGSFNDFESAVLNKLAREIDPIPEPATLLLFGFGLLGVAGVSRRKN